MKIKAIRTHHVRAALEQPFGFSQWYYDQRNVLLVEVLTDSGMSGWGECYGPADVTQGAIEHFYGPRLLGQNALCIGTRQEREGERGLGYIAPCASEISKTNSSSIQKSALHELFGAKLSRYCLTGITTT